MARRKQSVIQRDMRIGEVREDFLERDDLDLRSAALKSATNMRSLATGAVESRDGTRFRAVSEADQEQMIEINPDDDRYFGLMLEDAGLTIVNSDGSVFQTIGSVGWNTADDLWVLPLGSETLIGPSGGISALTFANNSFTLSAWQFADGIGETLAQPYWSFETGTTITPSALTGTITVTASPSGWWNIPAGFYPVANASDYRVRYLGREIQITSFDSPTQLTGTVVDALPPTFGVTVGDSAEFQEGQVVVGQDTNYQGIITDITGNVLTIATLSFFDGPDVGEKLSSATTTATSDIGRSGGVTSGIISAAVSAASGTSNDATFTNEVTAVAVVSEAATDIWDEPMMSDLRGWPRAAAAGGGRLALTDFPQIPNGIAISSARSKYDFRVGSDDDDAIARAVGDDIPRFRHVVEAGDLVFLSDKGAYVQTLRDNQALSPTTFNPVLFDRRGSNGVKPVQVNDGIIFVESNGETLSAALLDGNVYLKWRVVPISTYHNQLIKSPVRLCGPSLRAPEPEKQILVVNGDGTIASVIYSESVADQGVGIFPWETNGLFKDAAPMFGEYWVAVERNIDGSDLLYLESFNADAVLDCTLFPDGTTPATPITNTLRGNSVAYFDSTGVEMDVAVASDGSVADEPPYVVGQQIGLNFTATASPWPVEMIESARAGTFDVRCIRFLMSVQSTGPFQVKCNNSTREVGGYAFGDDQSIASPLRTEHRAVPVFGRRQHADLSVIKHMPGSFRILYLGQEVQV